MWAAEEVVQPRAPVRLASTGSYITDPVASRPQRTTYRGSGVDTSRAKIALWYIVMIQAILLGASLIAVCIIQTTMPSALSATFLVAPVLAYVAVYYVFAWVPHPVIRRAEWQDLHTSPRSTGSSAAIVRRAFQQPAFHTFSAVISWIALLFVAVYLVTQAIFYGRCPTAATPALQDTCTNGNGVLIGTLVVASLVTAVQIAAVITETIIAHSAADPTTV